MSEINYQKEKSWRIKEKLPIKATKEKNHYDDWSILIPPMTISWETFFDLYSSLSIGNAYGMSYDYEDGSPTLSVTDLGLKELLEMKTIIEII